MKIHIESATCQGHNRCAALAPDLFDIDDNGYASVTAGGVVPDGRTASPNSRRTTALSRPSRLIAMPERRI